MQASFSCSGIKTNDKQQDDLYGQYQMAPVDPSGTAKTGADQTGHKYPQCKKGNREKNSGWNPSDFWRSDDTPLKQYFPSGHWQKRGHVKK